MSTARTVGETKFWVNDVLYMVPDPVADEIYRLKTECIDELMGQKTSLDAYYKAKQARLSSEGALKDAVIEAARQYLKLNEHYASVGKTQLRDAIAELDLVSEGLAPDA